MGIKCKNKTRIAGNFLIFDFFLQLKFFGLLLQVSKNVCYDRIQKSHSFYKKKLVSKIQHQNSK